MDADTRLLIKGLNDALSTSGLTQAAFAVALGTSASRLSTYRSGKTIPSATFFLRATRIASNLRDATERGWMTGIRAATTIREALNGGDDMWAFKMALQSRDHLGELLSENPDIAGSWEAAPTTTGSARWDTLLATLAAHEFEKAGLDAPKWTQRPALGAPWTLDSPRLNDEEIRDRTPSWLAERGIFINQRDLATA